MRERTSEERLDHVLKEKNAISYQIGNVTNTWSTLEGNLCNLFSVMVIGTRIHKLTSVIFFTPNNTETRIDLVDNLISFRFPNESPIAIEWQKIKGKLDRLKNVRNGIVHGSIVSVGSATKSGSRLTPNLADALRMDKLFVQKGQLAGLGPNELENHVKAVWRLNKRVANLAMQVEHELKKAG